MRMWSAESQPRGLWSVAVLAGTVAVVGALGGCELAGQSDAPPATSTTPTASALAADTSDDEALVAHMWDFLPEIEGFTTLPKSQNHPVAAGSYFDFETVEVVPSACLPVVDGPNLATPSDLGDASGDLMQPVGFSADGEDWDEADEPRASVLVRVFGDPAVGDEMLSSMRGSDCGDFVMSYPEFNLRMESSIEGVAELVVEGLEEPALRVDRGEDRFIETEDAGDVLVDETYPRSSSYVYIDGAYAVSLWLANVEDPDVPAVRLISDFAAHVDTFEGMPSDVAPGESP